jgi:hypothetical protein
MSNENYHAPNFRSILIGIAAFIVLVFAIMYQPTETVKTIGSIFLFLPQQLHIVQRVSPEEVKTLDMSIPAQQFSFNRPGRYFVYYQFQFLTADSSGPDTAPRITMTAVDNLEQIPIVPVERGVQFSDTPLAPGRPCYTFEIQRPGVYRLGYARKSDRLSFVPDYTTDQEAIINLAYAIQIGIIVVLIVLWRNRRRRRNEQLLAGMFPKSAARREAYERKLLSRKPTDQPK